MTFKHFLFSRFNVQYLEMVPYNLDMDVDVWMEGRIHLFFDFCYPSVRNQSNKNFTWIVFFDSRTPKKYLDRIIEKDDQRIIEICSTDHWDKLNTESLQILEKDKHKYDQLISTRLDCDDAISGNFIDRIQSEVLKNNTQAPYAINFSNGVILDRQSDIYYLKKIDSNAFISLIQDKDSLDVSIFKMEHQNISANMTTVDLIYQKMWLQVVHGKNLINKSSGLPQFNKLGDHFSISNKMSRQLPEIRVVSKAYFNYFCKRANNLKIKLYNLFKSSW